MTKPRQPRKASKSARTKLGLIASLLSLAGMAGALGNVVAPQGIAFQGASQRFLTPNGRERNIYFFVQNPQFSAVSGKVFDILGHQVASMSQDNSCDGRGPQQCVFWDGTGAQHTGVYLYEITVGGQTFTGTVVVIR